MTKRPRLPEKTKHRIETLWRIGCTQSEIRKQLQKEGLTAAHSTISTLVRKIGDVKPVADETPQGPSPISLSGANFDELLTAMQTMFHKQEAELTRITRSLEKWRQFSGKLNQELQDLARERNG